jgi:hypothetical protein
LELVKGIGKYREEEGYFFDTTVPYVTAGDDNLTPVAGKNFVFPLDIALSINPVDSLPENESLAFEASSTLEVKYP